MGGVNTTGLVISRHPGTQAHFSEHWDETSRDCRGPPLHNELDQLECGTVVGWHWVHRTGHLNESIIDFQVRGTQAEVGGPVRHGHHHCNHSPVATDLVRVEEGPG